MSDQNPSNPFGVNRALPPLPPLPSMNRPPINPVPVPPIVPPAVESQSWEDATPEVQTPQAQENYGVSQQNSYPQVPQFNDPQQQAPYQQQPDYSQPDYSQPQPPSYQQPDYSQPQPDFSQQQFGQPPVPQQDYQQYNSQTPTISTGQTSGVTASVEKPKKSKKTLLISIVAGILFILLIILGMGLMNLSSENKELTGDNEKLQELVDKRETFNSLTREVFKQLHYFDGAPIKEVIKSGEISDLAHSSYDSRYDLNLMEEDIIEMQKHKDELDELVLDMDAQMETNTSETILEKTLDTISLGYSEVVYYYLSNNDCDVGRPEADIAGCVWADNPRVIHINVDSHTDKVNRIGKEKANWLFTGVIYHEYAHVLQYTNPVSTKTFVNDNFGGDMEAMADCFASVYYDPAIPQYIYNKGCSAKQLQSVEDWMYDIAFRTPQVTQGTEKP